MLKPLITIEDWSGGASLNPSKGKKNGYFVGNGADHFTRPGYLTVMPNAINLAGNSGASTVGDTVFCGLRAFKNNELYFGGTAGKIYRQDSANSVTLDHTSSNSNNIANMCEYKDYLYYAQDTKIGRGDLGTGSNPITYSDNWQTGLNTSGWKPMLVSVDNNLYIGHGYQLAKWDNSSFTTNALDLQSDYTIFATDDFGIDYIAIAANSGITTKNSKIFYWDRFASSWNNETQIPEKNIYAMKFVNGYLWVLAGTRNVSLYVVPLGSFTPTKVFEFKDQYYKASPGQAFPNAMSFRDGRLYFAISGIYRNNRNFIYPTGVYSVKANPTDLDLACHYVNIDDSPNNTHLYYFVSNLAYSGLETSIFYSEYNFGTGTNKRLLREGNLNGIDTSNIDSASVYTYWYIAPPGSYFHFDGFGFDCYPRDTGGFSLDYSVDFSRTFNTIQSNLQTSGMTGGYVTKAVICRAIMFKIGINFAASNAANSIDNFFLKRVFATGKLIPDPR